MIGATITVAVRRLATLAPYGHGNPSCSCTATRAKPQAVAMAPAVQSLQAMGFNAAFETIDVALDDGTGQADLDLGGAELILTDVTRTRSGMFNSAPPRLERVLQGARTAPSRVSRAGTGR